MIHSIRCFQLFKSRPYVYPYIQFQCCKPHSLFAEQSVGTTHDGEGLGVGEGLGDGEGLADGLGDGEGLQSYGWQCAHHRVCTSACL